MQFACTKCNTTKSTEPGVRNTVKGCVGYHDDDGDHPCPNIDRVDTSSNPMLVVIGIIVIVTIALLLSTI